MIKKLRLSEGDNFDGSVVKAANIYYRKFKYGEITTDEIKDEIMKFGHSEDFADSVLSIIADKWYEDELYYNDYDESFKRKGTVKESPDFKSWKETPFSIFYDGEKHTLSKYTKIDRSGHKLIVLPKYDFDKDIVFYYAFIDGENSGEKFINSGEAIEYADNYYSYYESKTRKFRRRIKEDSWDDVIHPEIRKRYIWPLHDDGAYEIAKIVEKYQNNKRDSNEIKSFDIQNIEYEGWPALQLEVVCSDRISNLIRKDLEHECLYIDDDDLETESVNRLKEANTYMDLGFDYAEQNADFVYGFRIYNEATDENTFVLSKNKLQAAMYGKNLKDIYKNYDENTIEEKLDYFYDRLPKSVIVTDPEYWTEYKDNFTDQWTLTDASGNEYNVTINGFWSGRF